MLIHEKTCVIPILLVSYGSKPLLVHQRNGIRMAFRCWANSGPRRFGGRNVLAFMYVCLYRCYCFQKLYEMFHMFIHRKRQANKQ